MFARVRFPCLGAFRASPQQQHHRVAADVEIHSIAWTDVDAILERCLAPTFQIGRCEDCRIVAYRLLCGMPESQRWQIAAYVAPDGSTPFADWLRKLTDRKARNSVRIRMARLRLGNMGDHKSIGHGVLELRMAVGAGYRVYVGRAGLHGILLLCGGTKQTQTADIKKAQEYWADYIGR